MDNSFLIDWFRTTTFLGLSVSSLCAAVVVALIAYLVMTTGLRLALGRFTQMASRTSNRVDDMLVEVLSGTSTWLITLIALLVGVGMLDLSDRWANRVSQLWFVALALQLALWANRAVGIGLRRHVARQAVAGNSSPQLSAAATLVSWGLRTLVWTVVLLAMLSNMGVNITAFIASLGVGGIAIALAAQTVLGDLFASLSIAVDKPFEVGDFIVLGAVAGTVEHVGLKSTRLRSLGGEQVVMSNTELLKQTVNNYKRLRERRIVFGFGVSYSTPLEQVKAIPELVRTIVEASGLLRFDRAHFKGFGESALDYEVVYIVLEPGFNAYMDEQQRINLALLEQFGERGIAFAFPSRSLYLEAVPEALGRAAAAATGRGPAEAPAPAAG